MSKHILIVDDDANIRHALVDSLAHAGYETRAVATGEEALDSTRNQRPDLVLLDIGLPGIDGLDTLRALRRRFADLPVIFITVRRHDLDEIVGLELGADDYVTKPFDMDVLLAHIHAVLRRVEDMAPAEAVVDLPTVVEVGDLRVDRLAHTVHIAGKEVALAQKLFELLYALACQAGRTLTIEELLSAVWGEQWVGEPQTLYVHIRWLREKIEKDASRPCRLLTVRGVGYKLVNSA